MCLLLCSVSSDSCCKVYEQHKFASATYIPFGSHQGLCSLFFSVVVPELDGLHSANKLRKGLLHAWCRSTKRITIVYMIAWLQSSLACGLVLNENSVGAVAGNKKHLPPKGTSFTTAMPVPFRPGGWEQPCLNLGVAKLCNVETGHHFKEAGGDCQKGTSFTTAG